MATPITWRNVETPHFGEASRMLLAAQSGFNSGFDQLNNVLKREQDTAEANWKTVRDNNTQAFLNSINQYRTPEEYQAALQSGALDLSKYGAQIDQAAARSALDGRLSLLQDRTVKANQFADMSQERQARPIVDRLNAMALSDDKDLRESAKKALGIYADNGMVPKASELAGKMRDIEYQNVERDRAGKKFEDELLTNKVKRDESRAHIRSMDSDVAYKAALGRAAEERATAEKGGSGKVPGFSPEAARDLLKSTIYAGGEIGKPEGTASFMEALKARGASNHDRGSLEKALSGLPQTYTTKIKDKEGNEREVTFPIPAQAAIDALGDSYEEGIGAGSWRVFDGYSSSTFAKQLKKRVEQNASKYASEYEAVQQALGNARFPVLGRQGVQAVALNNVLSSSENPTVADVDKAVGVKTKSGKRGGSIVSNEDAGYYPEDVSGSAVLDRAMAARLELLKSKLSPEELAAAKKGQLSYKNKKFLETGEWK